MNADAVLPTKTKRSPALPGALIALALCMLLSSLSTSIANVALPTLAEAFDASFQSVQWVVLAYLLTITTLIVSVGRLSDLIGRRRLLLQGLALFSAASVVGCLSPNLWLLIALLPFALVIRYGVVAREEAYLERKFGDVYRGYRSRVRRWL